MHESIHHHADTFKAKVEEATGVTINHCYQCGKCTAGCPLNEDMDIMPNQLLRMLQAEMPGYEEKILSSLSIWLCLACDTCYSRCPQEVLLSKVMDYLRQESVRQKKVNPKAKDILKFHQAFLNSVKMNGKLHEVGLTIDYKLRSLNLMQDVMLAPSMAAKGKLAIFPHKVQNTKAIADIFRKVSEGSHE